jgi:hypothetical protein
MGYLARHPNLRPVVACDEGHSARRLVGVHLNLQTPCCESTVSGSRRNPIVSARNRGNDGDEAGDVGFPKREKPEGMHAVCEKIHSSRGARLHAAGWARHLIEINAGSGLRAERSTIIDCGFDRAAHAPAFACAIWRVKWL